MKELTESLHRISNHLQILTFGSTDTPGVGEKIAMELADINKTLASIDKTLLEALEFFQAQQGSKGE